MSVKQSRNVESGSEVVEEDAEEFYSPEVKSRVTHFNQRADDISAQIDDLISGNPQGHSALLLNLTVFSRMRSDRELEKTLCDQNGVVSPYVRNL